MLAINHVAIIGNLATDPELRHTPQGVPVCDMRLAVNERFGSGENKREKTLFIDVVAWRALAENCAKYLERGQTVLVEGRLEQDEWTDKDTGQKRSRIRVQADNIRFGPKAGEGRAESSGGQKRMEFSGNRASNPHSQALDQFGIDDDVPF